MTKAVQVLRAGDTTKADPFTIAIVANPWLEAPIQSDQFIKDPVLSDQTSFNTCVQYILDNLFCTAPGQKEPLLSDPSVSNKVRVVSIFDDGLPSSDSNSLVAQDSMSDVLVARRDKFIAFLSGYSVKADIAYALSKSRSHKRASAWFTTDDDAKSGVAFCIDSATFYHRYYCVIPGTIAMHVTDTSGMTAIHEFGHAISSYSNGAIVDLYVDSNPALNNKHARPIPLTFGKYQTNGLLSALTRGPLSYLPGWQSYHCELLAPTYPAIMDNYWLAAGKAYNQCEHDKITREFIQDRIVAKVSR